jgi:exopolysaccharide production protein ExoQ
LFYGYLFISVSWAESSSVSFKRWLKDFGNVFVALVILTERNPQQAIRAVFVRCAYILLPLSVIFIRFFPHLGRRYSSGGELEPTGVTFQKNSLGALVLICGLVLILEWFERTRISRAREKWAERWFPLVLFLTGTYLLYLCDSKTSIVCLVLGVGVLSAIKLPFLRRRVGSIALCAFIVVAVFYAFDSAFGVSERVMAGLGRDMTLTGRTEVWRELLALETDPVIGTGFCSFWDGKYRARLPEWVSSSAHNGYLEIYIDGGIAGLFFLSILLVSLAWRLNARMGNEGTYPFFCFALFLAAVIGNLTESHFARMSPLWFALLVVSIEYKAPQRHARPRVAKSFVGLRPPAATLKLTALKSP